MGFSDWAWREWESEAILFLYYSPETGKFLLDAPPQTIYLYRRMGRWHAEGRVSIARCRGRRAISSWATCIRMPDLPAFFSAQDDYDDCEEGMKVVMGR